ncbi:hypothetical protein D3H65_13315 [Paraflavitalea soli]|uniref:Lipocalin-like domain-containing protein n=1 Tax=Paraflavitalea soli TaxID=2315862 RepID=A0A3B7MPJ5_9BACT|nr:hypothetical protein [Paraflavitalea soli]AXY74906.1 hypothetical protein D3H65_13315 [Paraflavitalea soli]
MYKAALILFLIASIVACKKDSTPASIEGKWEMIAYTPAPADVVLDWQPDNSKTTIRFDNGAFTQSTGSSFTRYVFKDNVLLLLRENNNDTLKLAVTTLSHTTLQYYVLNGRAPVASKFKRVR